VGVVNETNIRREPAVGDEDKLRRREQIMTAANKVFVRNGFHGTTIAEVAKEASLPFDAVYQYFDSKDALFHALIAAEGYALRTHVSVALAKTGTQFGFAEAPFRASLRATFEFFDANPDTAKLLFRDAYALDSRFDKQLGGIYERIIDDIESLVVAAQDRGDVVAVPPRLVAYMLTVLIGHMARRRLTTDDGLSAAEATDLVVALVIKGLRPSES
jgi:AcrR family transcriptional regulator